MREGCGSNHLSDNPTNQELTISDAFKARFGVLFPT
jgi:hypothetical protein